MSPAVSLTLVAVLAGVVAWEVAAPAPPDLAQPTAPRAVASGRSAPPGVSAEQTPRWMATTLARPLFSPDRRPQRHQGGTATVSDAAPVLPRLAGIIIDPAGGVAIFAPAAAGDKPVAVPVGGKLNAWTVVAIAPRDVRVRGPDGESTLHVAFDLAASAAPSPAAALLSPALPNRPINLHPMQQRRGNEAE